MDKLELEIELRNVLMDFVGEPITEKLLQEIKDKINNTLQRFGNLKLDNYVEINGNSITLELVDLESREILTLTLN